MLGERKPRAGGAAIRAGTMPRFPLWAIHVHDAETFNEKTVRAELVTRVVGFRLYSIVTHLT